ncbi:leucoanthocyanidin reductase-like [Nymphaea colorata]|nr:leucoanthocyanidin reductase-like [Nymphaea colorata]
MACVTAAPKFVHDETKNGLIADLIKAQGAAHAAAGQAHDARKPTFEITPPANTKDCRVLIIGATGYIGRFIAEASLASGRITYVLSRPGPVSGSKAEAVRELQAAGAVFLHGSMKDRDYMTKILRELKIDVVISAVGGECTLDQIELVDIIKCVGSVKRFLPSEFGHDIDKTNPVEPALTMYSHKRKIRRAVEASGIPYTYICCNSIAAWPYYDKTNPSKVPPPLDCFNIYGDGNVKAYFVSGTDIGKFTMKTVDDPRTINKTVHFRPPSNFLTVNELASMWEKKIGRVLPRASIPESQLLRMAKEYPIPGCVVAALTHDIFINGCQFKFLIDGEVDEEAGLLYPDTPYQTVDDCFDSFIVELVAGSKDGRIFPAA